MLRDLLRVCLGITCGFTSIQISGQTYSDCTPPVAQVDLDISNVRAVILSGGDMWWDLTTSRYEIPKGSGKRSFFCGGLWMGGLDPVGNLHVAAGTYRQSGIDFWTGPLDTTDANTSLEVCDDYDRIWKVNRADVESFIQNRVDPNYVIPQDILEWPGNGNTSLGHAQFLAPFNDVNGNGIYEPSLGDYPAFDFTGANNCDYHLQGDQSLWWVFNDRGNWHSETGGVSIGVEVHATAFAFRSQEDALANATFYRYRLINRSTTNYHDFGFAFWSDYDLGSYDDDYVGCDVGRGLGYCYNGDVNDGSSATPGPGTYGEHPPAVGIDFLQGPRADVGDNFDNDHDFVIDENDERIVMSQFRYYDGDFTVRSNPTNAIEFYYYLGNQWKDGSPMTYGGNAYGGTTICQYMFPGTSDPIGWGTSGVPMPDWNEVIAGNLPSDRRGVNCVGKFGFDAGEVDVITVGVPWARDTNGNNLDAIVALQAADDLIQSLFDNCFSLPCASQGLPEIT